VTLAVEKNIKVTFNGNPLTEKFSSLKIDLYFDIEKIQKILTNLLSNALKFTPEYGEINVIVEAEQSSDNATPALVKICIANSGEGIPKDNLPYVFDRFYQVDSDSTRKYAGTGIGLALVKELVELHQGNVSVESSNENTTFTVILPLNIDYLEEKEVIQQTSDVAYDKPPSQKQTDIFEVEQSPKQIIDNDELEIEDREQLEILIVEDYHDLRNFPKNRKTPFLVKRRKNPTLEKHPR